MPPVSRRPGNLTMRFPQTFIDDLRRQADIVRVIQDYVSLKKKGANWMACCPFHQEKTPSFSVNPAKDIFFCFGCQKGGSVFNFVMEIERVSFPEAVKIVAEKANVQLPAMVEDQKFEARRKEADEIIEMNSWALEWWEAQLEQAGAEARQAREYLQGRQISDETRKVFRLGYAPDSWDALSTHLKKRGATIQQIERSGLVVKKDAGGFYDRFRGRLIFPVMDAQGRAVAFGGRTLQPDGEPKYLNSPETAAYTKGRHLFGLNVTRDEIRRRKFAILVEGYLDLIIPYQFGVRNLAASLGTALTPEQAKLLGRFARKVVVNYDGDSAGVKAAKRAIETLLAEDFETKVLVLPDGADPDEFIRTHGVEAYHERRGKALPHIQFVLEQAVRDRNLLRPADKAAAVEEALPFVRAIRNGIQKREYFDMTMDALRVEEPALRRELWQTVRANAPTPAGQDVRQKIVRAAGAQPTIAEQRLLELLVHDQELRQTILPQMEAADYEELPTATIFSAMIKLDKLGQNIDLNSLTTEVGDDEELKKLITLISWSEPQREEGEAIDAVEAEAERCLVALRTRKFEHQQKELESKIQAAERDGDFELFKKLAAERIELERRQHSFTWPTK
jgi:DNA primase